MMGLNKSYRQRPGCFLAENVLFLAWNLIETILCVNEIMAAWNDTMKNIDLDYGSAFAAITIETVARTATLKNLDF